MAGEVGRVVAELLPVEHVQPAVAAAANELRVPMHHSQAVHLPFVELGLELGLLAAQVEALDGALPGGGHHRPQVLVHEEVLDEVLEDLELERGGGLGALGGDAEVPELDDAVVVAGDEEVLADRVDLVDGGRVGLEELVLYAECFLEIREA